MQMMPCVYKHMNALFIILTLADSHHQKIYRGINISLATAVLDGEGNTRENRRVIETGGVYVYYFFAPIFRRKTRSLIQRISIAAVKSKTAKPSQPYSQAFTGCDDLF
jgi:hypothetical protein